MKTEKKLLLSVLLAVCTTTLSAQAAAADTAPAAQPEKKEAAELKTAEAGDAVQQTEERVRMVSLVWIGAKSREAGVYRPQSSFSMSSAIFSGVSVGA